MKFEVSLWSKLRQSFIFINERMGIFNILLAAYIHNDIAVGFSWCTLFFRRYGRTLASLRKANGFLIIQNSNFIHQMPKFNEICKGAKYSNTNARQFHETKRSLKEKIKNLELREKIECDAKNFAYSFILCQGYCHEFAEYHRKNRGKNGHEICVDCLINSI